MICKVRYTHLLHPLSLYFWFYHIIKRLYCSFSASYMCSWTTKLALSGLQFTIIFLCLYTATQLDLQLNIRVFAYLDSQITGSILKKKYEFATSPEINANSPIVLNTTPSSCIYFTIYNKQTKHSHVVCSDALWFIWSWLVFFSM